MANEAAVEAVNIVGDVTSTADINGEITPSVEVVGEVIYTGRKGDPATITIGDTYTVEPGTPASVENVGTKTNAIFNFAIPKGETGEKGKTGNPGVQIVESESEIEDETRVAIVTDSDKTVMLVEKDDLDNTNESINKIAYTLSEKQDKLTDVDKQSIVKEALCSDTADPYTETEKTAARKRLGIVACTEDEYEALTDKSGIYIITSDK